MKEMEAEMDMEEADWFEQGRLTLLIKVDCLH